MMNRLATVLLTTAAGSTALAGTTIVDLDGLSDDSFVTSVDGVNIGVVNPNPGGEQIARVWNYTSRPQLLVGGHQTPFTVGNAADASPLKGLFVLGDNPSLVEGSRPNVDFIFTFDAPVSDFEFTIVDVEGSEEFDTDSGFSYDVISNGEVLGAVSFGDLVDPDSDAFDSSVAFGNGSANQFTLTAADFGAASFDSVELSLGGSATVNSLSYTTAVPTPGAAVAGLIGLGVAGMRRRRQA